MAAKDYKICPALFDAYIAKVSKRNPNQMTQEEKDKCIDCPLNDTSCPGGMWCTEED